MFDPLAISNQFNLAYQEAWHSGDPDRLAALYTEDAMLIGARIALGRGAIRDLLTTIKDQGFDRTAIETVAALETAGLVLAANTYTAEASQDRRTLTAHSSQVLQSNGDSWQTRLHSTT